MQTIANNVTQLVMVLCIDWCLPVQNSQEKLNDWLNLSQISIHASINYDQGMVLQNTSVIENGLLGEAVPREG